MRQVVLFSPLLLLSILISISLLQKYTETTTNFRINSTVCACLYVHMYVCVIAFKHKQIQFFSHWACVFVFDFLFLVSYFASGISQDQLGQVLEVGVKKKKLKRGNWKYLDNSKGKHKWHNTRISPKSSLWESIISFFAFFRVCFIYCCDFCEFLIMGNSPYKGDAYISLSLIFFLLVLFFLFYFFFFFMSLYSFGQNNSINDSTIHLNLSIKYSTNVFLFINNKK